MHITSSMIPSEQAAPCHEAMAIDQGCLHTINHRVIARADSSYPNGCYVTWTCVDGVPPMIYAELFDPLGNSIAKQETRFVNKNFIFDIGEERYMYVVKAFDTSVI